MQKYKDAKILLLLWSILVISPHITLLVHAQNLDSTSYTLVAPYIGDVTAGTADSDNYTQVVSPSATDGFTSTSTNYDVTGGFARLIQASVPDITCFETNTNSGTTSCTGLPGSDGMRAVCSSAGCYDRAKIEIDAQLNAADTRYAIQISTTSDFSSGNSYVDGTTRFLKGSLTIDDFIPKCEWEGTTSSGVCGAANTTWQRYNILGLDQGTTYYARVTAHTGLDDDGKYSQTVWGPSSSTTTGSTSISFDIDIAPNTSTPTSAPYTLEVGFLTPTVVTTSTDMIVFKLSSNALSGIETQVRGATGNLLHTNTIDTIPGYSGDLAGVDSGYGVRNNSSSNSAQNTGTIGNITVSSTPIDYTDSGAAHKVGAPTTSYTRLFTSGGAPLYNGITGYFIKVKPETSDTPGIYRETLTFTAFGDF